MDKPKSKEVKTKEIKNIDYEQYVGIDPGVRALFTSCNENNEILQCSTKEYIHNSKMIYACKKRDTWYEEWQHYALWKSIPSFKVSNTKNMLNYFEYVLPNIDIFFQFHCDKNFRRLNFTSYCRGKATLEKICRNITKDKNTLIGFGDYSQQHGLVKNHPTTPILKLKKELKRFCDVVDIDEWGTSKTCHKCFERITLYRNKKLCKPKGTDVN